MAKSNKQPQKPATAPHSTPSTAATVRPTRNFLLREPVFSDREALMRTIFYAIAGVALVVMIALSFKSGINADDKFQNDYSTKLVNYYSTFGQDTTALYIKEGNMHLYGGFFEITTGFVNKTLGYTPNNLGYHNLRHAASAILGWLAMLLAALLAQRIAGWRAGILTMLIMFLSPRFFGDSMMNPKDIPFACGYMMALYYMTKVLDNLPRPNKWDMAGLAGGLAIALATRAGGLLPFAYLFMFAGLHFLLKNGGFSALSNVKSMGRYLIIAIGIAVVGYILAVLFWPYALKSPLKNPLDALTKFEALEIRIRVLFEGKNVRSDDTPWYYAAKWILYTIPLATIVGFAGSLALSFRLMRRYNPLWIFMVFFAGIFPVAYIIYKDSVLHDGWRHLTFAYPPIAIAAGLFWNEIAGFFSGKKALQYVIHAAFGLLLADSAWFIAANPAMPYVYFNPVAGGVKGAFGQYETDYWGVSVRQGLEWMEEQGIINDTMSSPIVIATNMAYSAQKLTAKYGDKVKIKYLKWDSRCNDAWDYALYPTRTIGGTTLQRGFWPPDNAVHVIYAGGAPIMAVLKDNGRNCSLGLALLKVNDFTGSIEKLKVEIAAVPDNEIAWSSLGQAYMNSSQQPGILLTTSDSLLELSKSCCEKALEISPDDSQSNNQLGMYWIQKNDLAKAKTQFEYSVKMEPSNPGAFYYLALIAMEQKHPDDALAYLQKAINASPTFRPAYELAIQIHEQSGNTAQANQIRAMLKQLK